MSTKSHDVGASVADFLTSLTIPIAVPRGIEVLEPYKDAEVCRVVRLMCERYYVRSAPRLAIWGINPGRFGAGLTGLSFTDPHALHHCLGIESSITGRRELSAEFVQMVIERYGGATAFYRDVYLTALSPLGFMHGAKNLNFYDSPSLQAALTQPIRNWVMHQVSFGLRQDATIVLGTGKLKTFFEKQIRVQCGFAEVHYLEHPRFVMQYKRKEMSSYVEKYTDTIRSCTKL